MQKRFTHLDAMRFFALVLVVVAHAGLGRVIPGGSGLTIFFSLSGFIITYLMLRERDATGAFGIRSFYTRRALKIGPPFLVCVVIPTLILAVIQPIDWSPFLGEVFFYYNWFKVNHAGEPPILGTGVVWSLSIEEQFYIVFALIWLIIVKSKLRIRWLGIVAGVTAAVSLVIKLVICSSPGFSEDRVYYASDTRLDSLALGVLAAIALHHSRMETEGIPSTQRSFSQWLMWVCTKDYAFVFAVLLYLTSLVIRDEWFRYTFRFPMQSVATCVFILYGFGLKNTRFRRVFNTCTQLRVVQFLGLASYSVYLIHYTMMFATQGLMKTWPFAAQVVALSVVGTIPGILIYLAVERPIQRWQRRKRHGPETPKSPPAKTSDNRESASSSDH